MQQSLRMRTKRFRAKSTGSIDNVDVQRDGRIFPTPPRSQLPSRAAEHKPSVPTSTSGVTRKLRGIGAHSDDRFSSISTSVNLNQVLYASYRGDDGRFGETVWS